MAGSVLLVVLLIVGGFSWDRWLRYDDAAEFQGEWQTHGTTAVVVIDGETIKLTEDVSWSYKLDTDAKTISYTFGNMEGSGRYRSLDRSAGDFRWKRVHMALYAGGRHRLAVRPARARDSGPAAGGTSVGSWIHGARPPVARCGGYAAEGEPVAPEPEPEPAAEPERRLRLSPTWAIGRSRN